MLKTEELLDKMIDQKRYDDRLVPFIKAFFLYNEKQQFWDDETIVKKIELYQNRIDGMEFADLEKEKALMDFNLKTLVINKNAIDHSNIHEKEELMAAVFEEQEIAVKDDEINSLEFYKQEKNYAIERLKYATNQQDKQSVLNMICNAFNKTPSEMYEITDLINQEIEENSGNQLVREYLEEVRSAFLPEINNAVKNLFATQSQIQKKEEYKKIYAISLMVLKFRLQNPNENKSLIQEQYNDLKHEFSNQVEEYAIIGNELENIKIKTGWELNSIEIDNQIQGKLKKTQVQQSDNTLSKRNSVKVDNFSEEIDVKYLNQLTSNLKESKNRLTQEHIEQQIENLSIRYEERFRPIIKEYFRRSAQVYRWSKDEFDKKIKNYTSEVKQISIEKKLMGSTIATAGKAEHGKIRIKKDFIDKKNSEILNILFHEQEHSTDTTYRGRKTIENGLKHHNMNEYATEIGSMHLVGEKIYDDRLCFTHSMNGYDELKYAGSMMSAALGIGEFEFAKLRDKGQKELNKYMQEKYPYMNIEKLMEAFENILLNINESPSMIHMQQMSEAYAGMYHLSNQILEARLEHEKESLHPEDKKDFELKSKYEKTKIAYNIQQAKRKLHLKNRYMKPIIGKENTIKSDAKVTSKERKAYLSLVEKLYPEKNVHFDNRSILKHIDREIKHPTKGKIDRLLKRNKISLLPGEKVDTPINSDEQNERRKFAKKYEYHQVENGNRKHSLPNTKNQLKKEEERTVDN